MFGRATDPERSGEDASPPPAVEEARLAEEPRLLVVLEIAKILATQCDMETMLSRLLSCLIDTWEVAEAGLLLLRDPTDGKLIVRAAREYDLEALKPIRLSPNEAMSGRVFQTGRAELYPLPEAIVKVRGNLSPANREWFSAAAANLPQPCSGICIPLITAQEKLGVLILENLHRPGSFTEADSIFLQRVGDLIALSMENAQLRDELQSVQALDEANRLKAEVVSILAHEMRTPLTSIKGYSTALLMEETNFSPETQREFLEIIDHECTVLEDLIHDLLESSIIDAGLLKLEPQSCPSWLSV